LPEVTKLHYRGDAPHRNLNLLIALTEVAKNSMKHIIRVTFPENEMFDIGQDTRTDVAMLEYRYVPPFKFTGKIDKLTFKLEPEKKAVERR
jgi:hypothetical protein